MVNPTPPPNPSRLAEPPPALPASLIARFDLRRLLGQGVESQLWLAHDPRQGRELTLNFMRAGDSVPADIVAKWLLRARVASHLVHPNIAPVFDVEASDGWIVQVCEHLPGNTLAAMLLQLQTLAPQRAVAIACELLDALVVAHGAGVIHGNLTAAEILVDTRDQGRIMHIGFADWHAHRTAHATAASANLVAPEMARGAPATAPTDVYCMGLVLAEMLWGKSGVRNQVLGSSSPAASADAGTPSDLRNDIDEELQRIVRSALMVDPALRPSAGSLKSQLLEWSTTATTKPAAATTEADQQALQRLLKRMSDNGDFPAMSHAVSRILGMASSDTESVGSVAGEILKDVALSNKLLRMVNTAYYARGGSISTVSRAVSLVGFNAIRNMALGLVLLEQMKDKAHADMLTEEFLRALMAASLARELSAGAEAEAEEAFIGAMFQDLGRLLAGFYFPQEASAIQSSVQPDDPVVSEEQAAKRILGQSFESLALAVARAWELPQEICRYMRKPVGDPPARAAQDPQERMRWVTLGANRVADTLLLWNVELHETHLEPIYTRYSRTLGIGPQQMRQATEVARDRLIELVEVMDLQIVPGSRAHRLLNAGAPAAKSIPEVGSHKLLEAPVHGAGRAPGPALAPHEFMAAGLDEIAQVMLGEYKVGDVVRMVLETMYRGKAFDRVIFCMRGPKADALTGRFGLGEGVEAMVRGFEVSLASGGSDLFHMVSVKGSDTLIADTSVARVAQRLPAWYLRLINAPNFLLLPLLIKDKAFGLIYADMRRKDSLLLNEKELSLLRSLRNQAVMAFTQSH